jgi:hypothetical protein
MHQLYQNAMAVVRKFGKPDLFVTFTCNPTWPEIVTAFDGQSATDRPDIVVRVFKMKLDELIRDLTKKGVLGKSIAHLYTIEFQKRGLPHAHILLILHRDHKLRGPEDYDTVICAKILDAEMEPDLYQTVKGCMMHGPCGTLHPHAPCMDEATGCCAKRYPKEFVEATIENNDGYPVYRRRDDGRKVSKYVQGVGDIELDNRWVVPYNRC